MNSNHSFKIPILLLILAISCLVAGCFNRQYQPAEWKPVEPSSQQKSTEEIGALDESRLEKFGNLTDWTAENQVGSTRIPLKKAPPRSKPLLSDSSTLPQRNRVPTSSSTLPNRGKVGSTLPDRQSTPSTLPMRDQAPRRVSNGQTLPLRTSRPSLQQRGGKPSATTLPQTGK